MAFDALSAVRLLEPPGSVSTGSDHDRGTTIRELSEATRSALDLDRLIDAIIRRAVGRGHREGERSGRLHRILHSLPADPRIIAYRAAVIADLRHSPDLAAALEREVTALQRSGGALYAYEDELLEAIDRLSELETFVDRVTGLRTALMRYREALESDGLRSLLDALDRTVADERFSAMATELPRLRKGLGGRRSVTLGINLDDRLRPQSATLLAVHNHEFRKPSSLQRLLGTILSSDGGHPLHTNDIPESLRSSSGSSAPLMPLFQDLRQILRSIARPVARALQTYSAVHTNTLSRIADELALVLGVVSFAEALETQGYPMEAPEIDVPEIDATHGAADPARFRGAFEGLYPPLIAVNGADAVANDFSLDEADGLVILTGPNSGGKTTFVRALAQAVFLAQQGFPVPARRASLAIVPALHSLFAASDEPAEPGATGRLERELRDLSGILESDPPGGVFVFNEAFSSTGSDDAIDIAKTVIRGLVARGATVIFVTHLHSLAHHADEIQAALEGHRVVNLVAEAQEGVPTFRILRAKPEGKSHAVRLVKQYGLDYESIIARNGDNTHGGPHDHS